MGIIRVTSAFIILCWFSACFAQPLSLGWAKQLTGGGRNTPRAFFLTSNSELLLAGKYTGTIDLDPSTAVFSLTPCAKVTAWVPYITKLDSSGNFIWGAEFSCTGNAIWGSECSNIVTDNLGNVYTSGTFGDILDFDPGSATFSMNPVNGNIFICKLTSGGQFLWAKQIGDSSKSTASSMTLDSQNNIVIAGTFTGQADFDPGISQLTLTSNGKTDFFVCKLNSNGGLMWARSFGGSENESYPAMAIDPFSNIVFTLVFEQTVDFDPGSTTYTLSAASGSLALVKFSSVGNFMFAKQCQSERVNEIKIDPFGHIYLAGIFKGLSNISTGPGTHTVLSSGLFDAFLSKLDNSGNFIWGTTFGGLGFTNGRSIAIDTSRNIYFTGQFEQTVDFDPGPLTNTFTAMGGDDSFIIKYDSTGSVRWVGTIGGVASDAAVEILWTRNHRVYLFGEFHNSCDFEPGNGATLLTPTPQNFESFIAKYHPCPVSFCGSVGFDEIDRSKIIVYPNPSSEFISLVLDKNQKVVLFDALGRQLGEYNLANGYNTISVNHLPVGLYFIQVGNYKERLKLVRE